MTDKHYYFPHSLPPAYNWAEVILSPPVRQPPFPLYTIASQGRWIKYSRMSHTSNTMAQKGGKGGGARESFSQARRVRDQPPAPRTTIITRNNVTPYNTHIPKRHARPLPAQTATEVRAPAPDQTGKAQGTPSQVTTPTAPERQDKESR